MRPIIHSFLSSESAPSYVQVSLAETRISDRHLCSDEAQALRLPAGDPERHASKEPMLPVNKAAENCASVAAKDLCVTAGDCSPLAILVIGTLKQSGSGKAGCLPGDDAVELQFTHEGRPAFSFQDILCPCVIWLTCQGKWRAKQPGKRMLKIVRLIEQMVAQARGSPGPEVQMSASRSAA